MDQSPAAKILQQPADPKSLDDDETCSRGIPPRCIEEDYCGEITVGALLFNCRQPEEVWEAIVLSCASKSPTALIELSNRQCKAGLVDVHSLYAIILHQFTNKSFASYVSQSNLAWLFGTKFFVSQSMYVDRPYVNRIFTNWMSVFSSLQRIALEITDSKLVPSLKTYQLIVKEISQHDLWIQILLQEVLTLRCGPLTHLATNVTLENINYFMGKLKLASSCNYLHQFFSSPSVMGKASALFHLLEIHELIWVNTNWATVEIIVKGFYSVITWLIEKCKMAGAFLGQGYQWIKARFRREKDEKDQFPSIAKDLPETEAKAQNAKPANNCIFDAVAAWLDYDGTVVRTKVEDYIKNMEVAKIKVLNEINGNSDDAGVWKDTTMMCFNTEGMFDQTMIPYLNDVFEENFVVYNKSEGVGIAYADARFFESDRERKFINLEHYHFSQGPTVLPDKYVNPGGLPLEKLPQTPEKTVFEMMVESEKIKKEMEETPPSAEPDKHINEPIPESEKPTQEEVAEIVASIEDTPTGRTFLQWIKEQFGNIYDFFRENPIVGGLMSIAFTICSGFGMAFSKFSTANDKKSFWDKVSMCSKDFYYLTRGKQALTDCFSDFFKTIRSVLGIEDEPEVAQFKQNLIEQIDKAEKIMTECQSSPTKFTNDPQQFYIFRTQMEMVRKQYHDLIKLNPTVSLQVLTPLWHRLGTIYGQLLQLWVKHLNRANFRQRPVCVWLWGKTGLGKSELIQEIFNRINIKLNKAWTAFFLSKGVEFLNGFIGQLLLGIDDIGVVTGPDGCLDYVQIMNLMTTAPYNANMAGLEEKLYPCEPYVVAVASNHPTIPMNCGITDPMALEGRRDFLPKVSWPGHDECSVTDKSCEHWQAVREANAKAGKKTFDHLRLTLCNPLVLSNPVLAPSFKSRAKNHMVDTAQEEGEVTLDELVDLIIERMQIYEKNFKLSLESEKLVRENALKHSKVEVKAQATSSDVVKQKKIWSEPPNVTLIGPPGVGKTEILKQAMIGHDNDAFFIDTLEKFNSFALANFRIPGQKKIYLDDFSTFKNSEHCKKFFTEWKRRYDNPSDEVPWIMGVNPVVMQSCFSTYEEYEFIIRRSQEIVFTFKQEAGILNSLNFYNPKFYSYKHTQNMHTNGLKIDEIVTRAWSNGADFDYMSATSLAQRLKLYEPERISYEVQYTLPLVTEELKVDTLASVNMSSEEFIRIINKDGSSTEAITSLLSGSFASKKHTKSDIGARIWRVFQSMRHHYNQRFVSMDDFVLTGANAGFFELFNDGVFVLAFNDCSYALITEGSRVQAVRYEPESGSAEIVRAMRVGLQEVTKMDFLTVTTSTLPHWAMLAFDIFAIMSKFFATGAVIAYDFKQTQIASEAAKVYKSVMERTDKYISTEMDSIVTTHEKALSVKDNSPVIYTPEYSDPNAGDRAVHTNKRSQPRVRAKKQNVKYFGTANGGLVKSDLRKESDLAELSETVTSKFIETLPSQAQSAIAQISTDVAVYQSIKKVIANCVDIVTTQGEHVVYGLMVDGVYGTTVAHISRNYTQGQLMIKDLNGTLYTMEFGAKDEDCDRLDFKITGKNIKQFPKITNLFHPRSQDAHKGKLAVLITVDWTTIVGMPILQMRYYKLVSYVTTSLKDYYSVNTWSYVGNVTGYGVEPPIETKNGDCGSVMLICDSNVTTKVVGLHVAANNTQGFIREVTSDQYASRAIANCVIPFKGVLGEFEEAAYTTCKNYPVFARCTRIPYSADKTKIYKSPFAFDECIYEPAVLSIHDFRAPEIDDMRFKEAMKWCEDPPDLTPRTEEMLISRARELGDWYGQKMVQYGVTTKVLSKREALNRVRGYAHSQPIDRATSAGYPWSQLARQGKKELIDLLDDGSRNFSKTNDLVGFLHSAIDQLLKQARKEKPGVVAFWVLLKDELIKKSKIEEKTRTIAAAPLHFVIAARMYWHTIYAGLAELWHVLPCQAGIAPNTLDWHTLVTSMLRVSPYGYSLDHRDFDFNLHPIFQLACNEVKNAIARLTDENWKVEDDQVRTGLQMNILKGKIIVNGLVFEIKKGQMSGHPGTMVENSISSDVMAYDAWCELAPSEIYANLESFNAHTVRKIIGDDIFIMVAEECLEWYNACTVSAYLFETYGMKLTGQDKSDNIEPYSHFTHLEFLSRGFAKLNGYWVGPLKMERLMKPFHYSSGNTSHHWFLEQDKITPDLDNALTGAYSGLEEMFLHGPKRYEKVRRHLIKICGDYGLDAVFPTYQTAFNNFFGVNVKKVDLSLVAFSIDHSVINKLHQEPNWFSYSNRRCCKFGDNYHWDDKSRQFPTNSTPIYLELILQRVNRAFKTSYNEILVNEYPPGGSIPLHKDNEPGVDLDEGVACITLCGDGVVEWYYGDRLIQKVECYPDLCYQMTGKYVKDYYHRRTYHTKYTMSLTFRKMDA